MRGIGTAPGKSRTIIEVMGRYRIARRTSSRLNAERGGGRRGQGSRGAGFAVRGGGGEEILRKRSAQAVKEIRG